MPNPYDSTELRTRLQLAYGQARANIRDAEAHTRAAREPREVHLAQEAARERAEIETLAQGIVDKIPDLIQRATRRRVRLCGPDPSHPRAWAHGYAFDGGLDAITDPVWRRVVEICTALGIRLVGDEHHYAAPDPNAENPRPEPHVTYYLAIEIPD